MAFPKRQLVIIRGKSRPSRSAPTPSAGYIEALEGRLLLSASVVVNTTADQVDPTGSAAVSLRDAFAIAQNSQAAEVDITFNPKVFATAQTIKLNGTALMLGQSKVATVTITGPAAGVTISGGGRSGVIDVTSDSPVNFDLSHLSIVGALGNAISIDDHANSPTLQLDQVTESNATGAGVFADVPNSGWVDCTNSVISGNGGDGIGGTLACELQDSTISGNAWGVNDPYGNGNVRYAVALLDATISNNRLGGVSSGLISGVNSTISGNEGPGLYYAGVVNAVVGGDGTLADMTIANNVGGISTLEIRHFTAFNVFPKIVNCIVAGNAQGAASTDIEGQVDSSGYNLIGVSDGANGYDGWRSTDLVGTALHPENPQLSPLGNYGGPTQTMLPAPSSPAVNAGSNSQISGGLISTGVSTDQRGDPRIFGPSVDIGADEVIYSTITGTVFDDANRNGVQDKGEAGIGNQQVFLDLKRDGKEDPGDPMRTTNSAGVYTFTRIAAGLYRIELVKSPAWSPTSPANGYLNATVGSGRTLTAENFGIDPVAKPNELSGVTIGTFGSYQNDGNTIARATDGSLSTFFDGPNASGNWVGLDLGSSKGIVQIAYAPRSGYAGRMLGGKIQISTTANFSAGVTTIYTINSTPVTGSLTTITLSTPVVARYIRYLSPNASYGNISEFQVFE